MTELTIYPSDLSAMSIRQLAALPAVQKAEIAGHLREAQQWIVEESAKLEAACTLCYAEQARQARLDAGKEYGPVHFNDGPVRITVDVPKCITWDQSQLAAIARRIMNSGERVERYIDLSYTVPEGRYSNWSATLRKQFKPARQVTAGQPTFRLELLDEHGGVR